MNSNDLINNNRVVFNKRNVFSEEKEMILRDKAEFFSKLSLDELYEQMIILGVNFKKMHEIIVTYKRDVSNKEEDKKDLVYDQKYDLSLIGQLMDELINTDINITDITKKYGITAGTFATYMKRIKENDKEKYNQVNDAIKNKVSGRWRTYYGMNPVFAWKSNYFKLIMKRVKDDDKDKEKCLQIIKDAIVKNKNGELTELNKEIIIKSYPESIDLLKAYYDSLIYAHNIADNKKVNWNKILIKDRNTMLMIYAPYLASLSLEELAKYNKMFNMSMSRMIDLIKNYKKLFLETDKDKLAADDLNIIKQIVYDVLENDFKKIDLEKKYNLSSSVFDRYMEQLKSVDEDDYNKVKDRLNYNSLKNYYMMIELIKALYEYIVNGIEVDGRKVRFTMLDYYSITNLNTKTIVDFINNKSNRFNPEIQPYRGRILQFFARTKNVGLFESAETFSNKNLVIYFKDGNKVEFDYDTSKKVIDFLRENNIPTNYTIVYTAATRFARGDSFFPFRDSFEKIESNIDNVHELKKRIN